MYVGAKSKPKAKTRNTNVHKLSGSSLQKYMDRAVGSRHVTDLLLYEIADFLFRGFPGALGIFLRQKFYKLLLGECGKKVVFLRDVALRCPKRLYIEEETVIDERVYFDIKSSKAEVKIGPRCQIMRGVSFEPGYEGYVHVGEECFIGPYTILNGLGGIDIGRHTLIAGHCYIVAGNHDISDPEQPTTKQDFYSHPVVIEENVWLGAGVKILDGVHIGKGTVICAGSVVNRDIPEYVVAGGVPAKVIKSRVH